MVLAAATHPLIKMSQIISRTPKLWWLACAILVLCLVGQLCPALCDPMDWNLQGSSVHGEYPDKNIGVGCHALLQRIFPTQASNPGLLNWRQILYHLSHQGSLTTGLTSNLNTADPGKTAPPAHVKRLLGYFHWSQLLGPASNSNFLSKTASFGIKNTVKLLSHAAAAKSLQSCTTLCDPIDGSPPGSPVPGILQARTPEWVAVSFSNAWKWKVKVKSLSRVQLLATP